MLRWLKRFLKTPIVTISEAFPEGQHWVYIFGDAERYERRKFETLELALSDYKLTLAGLHLASPDATISLIKFDVGQARSFSTQDEYRNVVTSLTLEKYGHIPL
jgi:hypothetical protein